MRHGRVRKRVEGKKTNDDLGKEGAVVRSQSDGACKEKE